MDLSELLQWAETGQKDGTLVITHSGISKYFFFQEGKLIFFSSQEERERLVNVLYSSKQVTREQLLSAVAESKKLGIPFIAYLISEKIITETMLRRIMTTLVQEAIIAALQWHNATFEFREVIPDAVLNGPIKLNITQLLFKSAVQVDEQMEAAGGQAERMVDEICRRIQTGRIELPPTPALMHKLNRAVQDESASSVEIGKLIMTDLILTSKILKVVNSPFYHLAGEVTSLPQAINIIGLSAVKSIATAHSLSQLSPGNERKILPILQHSLLTAFIAKRFAPLLGLNPEELFVYGILHDIGKTVLINFLSAHDLSPSQYQDIQAAYHAQIGALLAVAWKFSAVVQETTRFHHTPEQAKQFPTEVMVIHFANRLANEQDTVGLRPLISTAFGLEEGEVAQVLEQIEGLFAMASSLV
jgi:putative nucleotidyltransferase with HDIG domain